MSHAAFRDRILELVRVPARTLIHNDLNWRTHPRPQREALAGVLREIGYAGALLARRRDDGRLVLIDGHLRAETSADQHVPVLVVDLNEAEADKLLAAFDPLTELAGVNEGKLADLLSRVSTDNPAVQAIFDRLADKAVRETSRPMPPELEIHQAFHVLVDCDDEMQQRELYERLAADGLRCRLLRL